MLFAVRQSAACDSVASFHAFMHALVLESGQDGLCHVLTRFSFLPFTLNQVDNYTYLRPLVPLPYHRESN